MPTDLDGLLAVLRGAAGILILPHNDPDPDAIASAMALRYLLEQRLGLGSTIAYRGIVGRAENRAMVRYLGNPLRRLVSKDLSRAWPIALVDTQPGAGNNALPPGVAARVVLDHHPWRETTATAAFADVRPNIGSTSTLLAGYLDAAGIEPPRQLATALFYGIKADTLGLARNAGPADVDAYFALQRRVDLEALGEIEQAQVPAAYFQQLDSALHAARLYGEVVVSHLGSMPRPDLAAEMADFCLRLKGATWTVCSGVYEGDLILAVRTRSRRGGAGQLVQTVVGEMGSAGGHGVMAGGQVPLRGANPEQLALQLGRRALDYLGVDPDEPGVPLIA